MLEYRAGTPSTRDEFTRSLDMNNSYRLQAFGTRSSLVALRTRSPRLARAGLLALVAIDSKTIDFRDAGWGIAKTRYVMARLGMNAAEEFADALSVACPTMADSLSHQVPRVLSYRSLVEFRKHDLMAVEVVTPSGPGFVDLHIVQFEPRYDILGALVRAAGIVGSSYARRKVEAADDHPLHWVSPDWRPSRISTRSLISLLPAGLLGAVNVHAELRPEMPVSTKFGQKLWISIIETESPEIASRIARTEPQANDGRTVSFLISVGPLVGFVQGWHVEPGLPLFESADSLERCREPLRGILEDTPPLPGDDPFELSGVSLPGGML